MGALGLVRVYNNDELAARAAAANSAFTAHQDSAPVTALAGHVTKFWDSAWQAKMPVERQMLANLRARNGVYEPEELALIRSQGGSEIYMMLTSAKCRGAEAWLREILLPDTDRPWGLNPTPMPDLPPGVQNAIIMSITQMAMAAGWEVTDARVDEQLLKLKYLATKRMQDLARKIADRHELRIEDQFAEGGWEQALSDCIFDLVTFPAAIMKGPFLRRTKGRQWIPGPNGQWYPHVTDVLKVMYERRSPFDIYPAAKSRGVSHGNLIDRHFLVRQDIVDMMGTPGYAQDALEQVLDQYGAKGYRSRAMNDTERATLELRQNEWNDPEGDIEAHQFWGSVSGRMLMEWGFQYNVRTEEMGATSRIETHKEYQVEVWKIGRFVVKAQINPDPLGQRPYDKCSFEEIPGAFWGKGIPEIMSDCQRMCNGASRALANNAAIASGPQTEVNVDRVAPGESITKPYPWKLWQTTTDMTGNNQPAVRFYQPPMNVQELLALYNHFDAQADNVTGFPKYSYGDSRVGGAGRTSSGLAQLMGNVGKGVRRVVAAMDRNMVRPKVTRTYNFNMEYDPDPSIKMDLEAVASGTAAVLMKSETAMRQKEMLQATLNPIDAQIIGMRGRAQMLRPALKNADFPVDEILPDELELQLIAASSPPPHELVGKTGPNGGSGTPPGMGPTGGTPEESPAMDAGGQPVNGSQQREQHEGFRDGGAVRRPSRVRLHREPDGDVIAEELVDSV